MLNEMTRKKTSTIENNAVFPIKIALAPRFVTLTDWNTFCVTNNTEKYVLSG